MGWSYPLFRISQDSRSNEPEKRHFPGGFWAIRLRWINHEEAGKNATPAFRGDTLDDRRAVDHKCGHENVARNHHYYLSDHYQLALRWPGRFRLKIQQKM
ncbi:hypothetical protein [Phyllobacterium sp. YR620]|uniref:hypothetical protein n=1 Tax=Phyllobacterium sp. YR620 TaxID=1881066 RepID=UPI00111377D3|nr:hypothetical protein [Phyllobacterium sp. YR620]